jgi:hypothetical protein
MPTKSFCERIQAIVLRTPPASNADAFRDALASTLVVPGDDGRARSNAMLRLVRVLNDGVPCGALSAELHRLGTVLNLYRYEREPTWLGTHRSRRALVEELWRRAAFAAERDLCNLLARAALLLAAEEGPPFGLATVHWLASRASFNGLTGLGDETVPEIVSELDREHGITGRFVASLNAAKDALDAVLGEQSAIDDDVLRRLVAALESMASLAEVRPDIQWRLANLIWRLANTARVRGRRDVLVSLESSVARWKASLRDLAADRWLDEAMTAPAPSLRGSGLQRVMTCDGLRLTRV